MQGSHILPSLLHQRHQEVDGHGQVLPDVVLAGLDVADGGAQA